MVYKDEIAKARRFSLVIGLVLLVYAISGVQEDGPAKISLVGFSLPLPRRLLGWGLFLASIYGLGIYYYYAFILTMSPMKTRRMLLNGELSIDHCEKLASDLGAGDDVPEPKPLIDAHFEEKEKQVGRSLASRYYPFIAEYEVGGKEGKLKFNLLKPTAKTKRINNWESFYYYLPIMFNILALVISFMYLVFPTASKILIIDYVS